MAINALLRIWELNNSHVLCKIRFGFCMNDARICVFEPDEIEREILVGILSDDYNVEVVESDQQLLQSMSPEQPTLIILETLLPGPTGYELCTTLRQDYSHCIYSVVFLSAKTSVEERLRGLEAGADDYINKPYDILEISAKVRSAFDLLKTKVDLKEQLDYASQTAFHAMSAQSEMGIILKGVQNIIEANGFDCLCQAVFSCLNEFGLKSTLYYEDNGQPVFVASPGRSSSSIEQEIITVVRQSERIWTKGNRTIFTFGDTSLLILNMPEDQDKSGRLRDSMCFLMETFDVKTDGINKQQALVDAQNWQESVKEITILLEASSNELQESVHNSQNTIKEMLSAMDLLLPSLALEEDQEDRINHIFDSSAEQFNESNGSIEKAEAVFGDILQKLQSMQ